MLRRLTPLLVAALLTTALGGCGGDDQKASGGRTPEQALALAKKALDETSGVHIDLATDDLPDGTAGVTAAEGVGTHDPAFDGSITVSLAGQTVPVPVIAVDGKVWAQVPFVPGWSDVDPDAYGAPDPAQLMSPDGGFSALLTATTGAKEGESVRGGEGNKEVLTEYTGQVPGTAVEGVIPSATGDFDAVYTLTADGELRTMELTGVFYPGTPSMTYTVAFDDYGTQKDITAP